MDNMAYLQQIAGGGNNKSNSRGNGTGFLSKFMNKWTAIIGGFSLLLIIGLIIIVNILGTVDTKDQDLMKKSFWASKHLTERVITNFQNDIKSSDIRNMTASLSSVLNEIQTNESSLLSSAYNIIAESTQNSPIEQAELERLVGLEGKTYTGDNVPLYTTLENGKLNGILDRVFLREMTLQIAILISYQSECADRTKNASVKEFSEKAKTNLQDLYDQFYNFKSKAI